MKNSRYPKKTNEYLLFIGQNASFGKQNPNTGLTSYFGDIVKFKTAKEREYYSDNYLHYHYNATIVKKGARSTLRKYFQGLTINEYNNYIDRLHYTYIKM